MKARKIIRKLENNKKARQRIRRLDKTFER